MSQHRIETKTADNLSVRILCGWDRMLQEHFLDVYTDDTDSEKDDDEICLYNSIEDIDSPGGSDWAYFASKLESLGINIPSDMSTALVEDSFSQVGNVITFWSESGIVKQL